MALTARKARTKAFKDSWSTLESASESELECSTCSSLNDEDCSYKRTEADHYLAASFNRPRFAREGCYRLVEKVENDLAEEYVKADSEDEDSAGYSSSSCSSGAEEDEQPAPEPGRPLAPRTPSPSPSPSPPRPPSSPPPAHSPLDYFYLVFNRDFVQFLVDTINARGTQFANTKKKVFTPTDIDEVYTLLSTHFMIGHTLSNPERIFGRSLNTDLNMFLRKERYAMLFGLLMHRDLKRTKKAYRSWYDLAKPLADKFNALMKSIMVPGKHMVIDKEVVLYFNKSNFIRSKADRVRMHFISDDNGIFQRVFLVDPTKQLEVRGEKIARALMEDFLDAGRSLHTVNNYYSSVTMAEDFLKRKTYLTGVLKNNRPRNPAFLKYKASSTKMPVRTHKEGSSVAKKRGKKENNPSQSKETTIVHGYNEKGVCVAKIVGPHFKAYVISTEFDSKPAENKAFYCNIIENLFKHTHKPKQIRLLSQCGQTPKRKFSRHIAYMIQALLVNSYLMYKVNTGRKIKFVNFVEQILLQMLPHEAKESEDEENENKGEKKKPKRRRSNNRPDACVPV